MGGTNKLICLLFLSGFISGIGATLITQYINKHVQISVSFDHAHDFH